MNTEHTQFMVPSKARDMKQIRVYVKGEINKYGECSERALQNARKHGTNVKVIFSRYAHTGEKRRLVLTGATYEEYISAELIK